MCPASGGRGHLPGGEGCDDNNANDDDDVQVKYPVGSSQRTFWEITGQQRWNWKETICSAPNPGTRSVGEKNFDFEIF